MPLKSARNPYEVTKPSNVFHKSLELINLFCIHTYTFNLHWVNGSCNFGQNTFLSFLHGRIVRNCVIISSTNTYNI